MPANKSINPIADSYALGIENKLRYKYEQLNGRILPFALRNLFIELFKILLFLEVLTCTPEKLSKVSCI